MTDLEQGAPTLDCGRLRKLPADWDSYGARQITYEAVKTAENLAAVPMNDGGIQLELHAGGIELEVEISPTGQVIGVHWEQHI